MITSELRTLTDEGLHEFSSWLDRAENSIPKRRTAEPPPTNLLLDDGASRPIGLVGALAQRRFARKYDLGKEICDGLGKEVANIMNVPNVWPWLSLFYYETTFPLDKEGRWFTGERSRHVIQNIVGRKQDQSHRHLVKSAVTNVFRFGQYAIVLMGGDVGQSKIEEQVMSRRVDPPLAHHSEFVRTLHRLYWDVEAGELKPGASGEGPASIMHMIDLLTQFDLTFDISSLEVNDFMGLLPRDFDRFFGPQAKAPTSRISKRSWLRRLIEGPGQAPP